MKQLVSVNLTTRTARDWTPPEQLYFGESLTLALRFSKNSDGAEIEADLAVSSISASIGHTDARPTGGKYAIKIGPGAATASNTTRMLDHNARASDIEAAINATPKAADYGTARVIEVQGSYLIFFSGAAQQIPLEVVNNGLWPSSWGRVRAKKRDAQWIHELRLVQVPVALTTGLDVVLPPAPKITRLQGGGSDGAFTWNEIQELYIPREFRGAFILKMGFAKTRLLSRDESPDTIQTALQALGEDCFAVTLPLSQRPAIEFVGDYAGLPFDELGVEVKQAPAGDVTFTLKLDRDELATALRGLAELTLPLQITVRGTDEGGFEDTVVALTLPVTIKAPVHFPELEEIPPHDLVRPYSPKTYVPFGANQILTGNKYYTEVIGDGETDTFVLTTGLGGEMINVFIRENISGGRLLVQGTDYAVTLDSANEVTVTALLDPPASNGWVITAYSAQTAAQWANDLTVTVPQVIAGGGYPSLPDFMDNVGERLEALEEILPSTGPGAMPSSSTGMVTIFRPVSEVLFQSIDKPLDEKGGGLNPAVLPSRGAPIMLPAIHTATTPALPDPLPDPSTNGGKVWKNETAEPVIVASGGKLPSVTVPPNGFVGCDGRTFYGVFRDGSTNSYYPQAYERVLFMLPVNDKMLAVGRTLDIRWAIQMQLAAAAKQTSLFCKAQWVMRAQLGTMPQDTAPSPVGLNLQNVVWNATPVFQQRIVIGTEFQSHGFGLRIKRLAGGMTLDQQIYGVWGGNNDAAPVDANFAVRGILTQFDTENSQPLARCHLYLGLSGGLKDDGSLSEEPAKAIIN